MRAVLASLLRLILGETWTIPAGVFGSIALALLLRDTLPEDVWRGAGGFALAAFVVSTLAYSLRERS
jgi:hypothetical protein